MLRPGCCTGPASRCAWNRPFAVEQTLTRRVCWTGASGTAPTQDRRQSSSCPPFWVAAICRSSLMVRSSAFTELKAAIKRRTASTRYMGYQVSVT